MLSRGGAAHADIAVAGAGRCPPRYPAPVPKLARVIHSDADSPPGYLGEAARAHGYELCPVVVDGRVDAFDGLPDTDLVIVTGSDEHWWQVDDHPHLQRELEWLRNTIEDGTPILGACFGGQGLALALGGQVRPMGTTEIGWVTVEPDAPGWIEPGPWFSWHSDDFTLPDGAELLAHNDRCIQAFRSGPHLGLQFHPEVSPEMLARWVHAAPRFGVDPDALIDETSRRGPQARERALWLFERFLSHVTQGSPA